MPLPNPRLTGDREHNVGRCRILPTQLLDLERGGRGPSSPLASYLPRDLICERRTGKEVLGSLLEPHIRGVLPAELPRIGSLVSLRRAVRPRRRGSLGRCTRRTIVVRPFKITSGSDGDFVAASSASRAACSPGSEPRPPASESSLVSWQGGLAAVRPSAGCGAGETEETDAFLVVPDKEVMAQERASGGICSVCKSTSRIFQICVPCSEFKKAGDRVEPARFRLERLLHRSKSMSPCGFKGKTQR